MKNPLNKKWIAGLTGLAILVIMGLVLLTMALYNRFATPALEKAVEGGAATA